MQIEPEHQAAEHDRLRLAKRILRYLQENPYAKDTLEGLTNWWLLKDKISEALEQISETVEWLVAIGYLRERQLPGNVTYYEINTEKRDEVDKFLKGTNQKST